MSSARRVDVVVDPIGAIHAADLMARGHRGGAGGRQRVKRHAGHPGSIGDPGQAELVHERKEPVVGTPPTAAQVCTACHGSDGRPVMPEYPNLSGQHADYLMQALRDYKSGKRKNAVMSGIVGALEDKDIESVASFYANQAGLCDTKQIQNFGQCKN